MTLIQRNEGVPDSMDGPAKEDRKSSRPVRNRRHTRRCLVSGQRPQKRLFTPEIKRYLKDWLVRRRENPYPNREEKKILSRETGLTYIQICNWFANWRRKLKNVNAERNQLTWGHLIRTYNDRAQGNVEQFSICSDDSIWSEQESISRRESSENNEQESPDIKTDDSGSTASFDHGFNNNCNEIDHTNFSNCSIEKTNSPVLLTKWLESAARFKPSETNYSWWPEGRRKKSDSKLRMTINNFEHDRDEVEAAVALTTLASSRIGA
ncbi:homeobox protein Mohawk [Pieris brassicae]|uniref:homeobox protein Mohawk n=1 Tax=Pieris brassicae TaxID=7116 RepID=UPI001E65F589|nr:homeobox protein Mohawk [Pieris brassicae]XP_045520793.1 homeobox protein Mohawk [Pieris brassicae]